MKVVLKNQNGRRVAVIRFGLTRAIENVEIDGRRFELTGIDVGAKGRQHYVFVEVETSKRPNGPRRVDADIKALEARMMPGSPDALQLAPHSRYIQNVINEVRSLEAQLVRERKTFELGNEAVLDAIGPYQDEQACDKPNAVEGVQALHDHIKKLDEALATSGRERHEALGQLGKERNAGYVDGRRSAFQEIRDAIDRGEAGF